MAKPSKSAKTERQKLIEDTLKKQRSSEKHRGNIIIVVAVLIAVAIIGVALAPKLRTDFETARYDDDAISEIGAAASVCQDPKEETATGVSNHVPEPQEVTYDIAPPAYGPHWNAVGAPAPFEDKFYDESDRPALEALVHNLEHGYTILWYDDTIAGDATQVGQIKAIAKKFKESGDEQNFRNKFIAAPWLDDDEDGAQFPDGQHVAFTHWKGDSEESTGAWQYCSDVSGEALTSFMDTYPYTDAPEATVP